VTRVVRFFFDHGHPWPLWEDGSEKYTTDPGDYGLSDDLAARLRSAYALWESHRDLEGNWSSERAREQWRAECDEAVAILRREVADIAEVRDERGE